MKPPDPRMKIQELTYHSSGALSIHGPRGVVLESLHPIPLQRSFSPSVHRSELVGQLILRGLKRRWIKLCIEFNRKGLKWIRDVKPMT